MKKRWMRLIITASLLACLTVAFAGVSLAEESAMAEEVAMAEEAAMVEEAAMAEEVAMAEEAALAEEAAIAEEAAMVEEAAMAEGSDEKDAAEEATLQEPLAQLREVSDQANHTAAVEPLPKTKITLIKNYNAGIQLKWKAVKGAEGYRVYRRSPGNSWKRIAQVEGTVKYLDKKCVSGTKYAYLVRAYQTVNGKIKVGSADYADRALIVRLDTPAKLKAEPLKDGRIRISWEQVEGATAYEVYRQSLSNGNWYQIGATKKMTYVNKDLSAGKIYHYYVKARKGSYLSSCNAKGKAAVSLTTPVMNSAEPLEEGMQVSWAQAKSADGYAVYRKVTGGSWHRIADCNAREYLDQDVSFGTTYWYMVCPYKTAGSKTYYGTCDSNLAVIQPYKTEVMALAEKRLKEAGGTLKDAFEWAAFMPYEDNQPMADNSAEYAKWSLEHKRGFCYGKASAFCYMARVLGYDAWVMEGYVYNSSGGLSDHGWVEIVYKGETYVCDPSFHGANSKYGYTGYFIHYGQKNTWRYTQYKKMDE